MALFFCLVDYLFPTFPDVTFCAEPIFSFHGGTTIIGSNNVVSNLLNHEHEKKLYIQHFTVAKWVPSSI